MPKGIDISMVSNNIVWKTENDSFTKLNDSGRKMRLSGKNQNKRVEHIYENIRFDGLWWQCKQNAGR